MAQAKSLTTADIERVLNYIAHNKHATRNRAMLLFTVLAGLRVSELAGLTIQDVRNADGTIKTEMYLSAERVKHGTARTVFISTRLQAELADYIETRVWLYDTQPLFSTQRGIRYAFTANTLTQHFFWLYRKAGLQNSSHGGRKTFISSLASQGVNVFVLAKLAGHKDVKTTMRYVTTGDEVLRRAVELV